VTTVRVFASAPAAAAREPLAAILREHAGAAPIVYLRDRDRSGLAAVLEGRDLRSDKPGGGRLAFVRALRAEGAELAVALWLGHDEYWPAKALFLLARAKRKVAVTERGTLEVRLSSVPALLAHATWRRKHRVPSPYGRGGLLRALLRWAYRATLGRVIGALVTAVRYSLSR